MQFFSIMISLCWFHWFLLCYPVWTNQNLKFIIYEGSCHSKNFCVEFYMVASQVVNKGLYWHVLWPFDNLDLKWEVPKSWSVMFLSINPFCLARSEEKCLVRSGLVQLMDRLCSLSSQTESSSSEKQTKKQKVATMAWAAFQVLANRCVEWEKEEGEKLYNRAPWFLLSMCFFFLFSICTGWGKERLLNYITRLI